MTYILAACDYFSNVGEVSNLLRRPVQVSVPRKFTPGVRSALMPTLGSRFFTSVPFKEKISVGPPLIR